MSVATATNLTHARAKPKAKRRERSAAELERLWALAERLQGSPLPGVHVTESQFEADYFDEDLNAEWVNGEVILMSPANIEHSDLNLWLARLFCEFVEHHDLGKVLGPEVQVRLPSIHQRRNPDVLFVSKSKLSLLRSTYLDGAPDLAMEIVSPDSVARDWRDKYLAYESSGVREYWVISPANHRVEAYALGRSKKYALISPDNDGRIHSKVLRGLFIRPEWLWKSPLPKLSVAVKELGLRR